MYLLDKNILDFELPQVRGVKYKNFEPYDLQNFNGLNDYELSHISIKDRERHIIHQSELGPTISAVRDGHTLAIFGGVLLWRGVAEAWSVFDPQARRYKIAMCKGAFAFFDIICILYQLHRIQITVKKDDTRAVAWATYIGFEPEGLMQAYSADMEDTYIMGKIYGRSSR